MMRRRWANGGHQAVDVKHAQRPDQKSTIEERAKRSREEDEERKQRDGKRIKLYNERTNVQRVHKIQTREKREIQIDTERNAPKIFRDKQRLHRECTKNGQRILKIG